MGREREEKGVDMPEGAVLGGRGAWSQVWYHCVHSVPPWGVPGLVSREVCDLEQVPYPLCIPLLHLQSVDVLLCFGIPRSRAVVSACDCMVLRICRQERESTQKIQIMGVSGNLPSKWQRHLQAPGGVVGVMCARRSVEMGE